MAAQSPSAESDDEYDEAQQDSPISRHRAWKRAALAGVFDDDDLLHLICQLGDQEFLRSARFTSKRLRIFATATIRGRFADSARPEMDECLKPYQKTVKFLKEKMKLCLHAVHAMSTEIVTEKLVVDPAVVRCNYLSVLEMSLTPAMVCETCPTKRIQQAVLAIAMVRAEGVAGPHVIVAPDVAAWKHAFQTLTPGIPLIVNEGTQAERRNKVMHLKADGVWLSSYSLALRDNANVASSGTNYAYHIKSIRPKLLIFDQGLVLRRGWWKKSSQSRSLFDNLFSSRFSFRKVEPFATFLLGDQASARAFSDDEMHWLLDIFARGACKFDKLCAVEEIRNLTSRNLVQVLRGWGVGERDAPGFIDPLLRTVVRELVFGTTPLIQGCVDESASA